MFLVADLKYGDHSCGSDYGSLYGWIIWVIPIVVLLAIESEGGFVS